MSTPPLHVGPATDPARYVATDQLVWSEETLAASAEEQLLGLPEDARFAADRPGDDSVDPATYPGVYGVYPLTLSVPADGAGRRRLPCAGLTYVGVHPDHRRTGVLTAMLRHHFEQVHEQQGVHLSALHASEPTIYGRHGYGLASTELVLGLGRGTTLTAPGLDEAAGAISTRMTRADAPGTPARLRECHLAVAEVGAVVGDEAYYGRICRDLPEHVRGKEPWRAMFAQRDGRDVGFALFRRAEKWEHARPDGEVSVWTLQGEPAAQLALARRLVDFDLMGRVTVSHLGVDDPLLLWAGGPRGTAELATYDSLWVRLVDLPEALQARVWNAACDVVVEVDDRAASWNAGRWRIVAGASGEATVERTDADADVRLPVDALGGAYLGGGNLVTRQRAGLVEERRPGAVAELWHAMQTPSLPTAAIGF